jgi:hypothetical protein
MQLGLYLPGLSALSGVQSLRILDSDHLEPPHFSVAPAAVHADGELQKPAETGISAVTTEFKLSDDCGERVDVRLLCREQGVTFEEWDDTVEEVAAPTHHEDQRSIASTVRSDGSAAKPLPDQLENLCPVAVLADMKLRYELKPDATARIALHRDREASFSVDVTRDVAIQPFLLIVRTRHVVTIVNVWSDVDD